MDVADIVDAFFHVANEARGETDEFHALGDALVGDDDVFSQGGGLVGLIDAQLDLVIAIHLLVGLANDLSEVEGFGDGFAVLDGAAHAGFFVEEDLGVVGEGDGFSEIAFVPSDLVFDLIEFLAEGGFVVGIGLFIDVVRGVDGE